MFINCASVKLQKYEHKRSGIKKNNNRHPKQTTQGNTRELKGRWCLSKYSSKRRFIFISVCMLVSMCLPCVWVPWRPEGGIRSPGAKG